MAQTLFEEPIDAARRVALLIDAYEAELLAHPPVPALGPENPRRKGFAVQIARKDVARVLTALEAAGLEIREKEA